MDSIASITFPTVATPLAFLYFFVSTVGGKNMSSVYWVADLTEKAKRKKLIFFYKHCSVGTTKLISSLSRYYKLQHKIKQKIVD